MPKKAGIRTTVIGIKNLKFWSNVKDIDIQDKLDKKKPNPNNHPYRKKIFLFWVILDFLNKNIKKALKVKKFTIK